MNLFELLNKRFSFVVIAITLFIVYSLYFYQSNYFVDGEMMAGDNWEYQSMAVNFAKGHGIHKCGGLEPFETYKFVRGEPHRIDSYMKMNFYGFTREPGTPLFAGLIYKMVGIYPIVVKKVQFFMMIFIAAFLPWIGYKFYGKTGFFAGLIGGPIFFLNIYMYTLSLLTESLITFSAFLITVSFIFYENKKNILTSAFIGFCIAIALLIKSLFTFVPILVFIYFGWQFWKTRQKSYIYQGIALFAVLIITILPWSIYASARSDKNITIVHPDRSYIVALHANNEFCEKGAMFDQWQGKNEAFYNNDGMEGKSAMLRVVNFYIHHPQLILKYPRYKFIAGFFPMFFLWVILVVLAIDAYGALLNKYFKSKLYLKLWWIISIPFAVWLLVYLYRSIDPFYTPEFNDRMQNLMDTNFFWLFLALCLPIFLVRRSTQLEMPVVFQILFYSFIGIIVITLVNTGDKRFVNPINMIFVITGINYVIKYSMFVVENFGFKFSLSNVANLSEKNQKKIKNTQKQDKHIVTNKSKVKK